LDRCKCHTQLLALARKAAEHYEQQLEKSKAGTWLSLWPCLTYVPVEIKAKMLN